MSEFFRRFKDLLWSWILRNVFGYTGIGQNRVAFDEPRPLRVFVKTSSNRTIPLTLEQNWTVGEIKGKHKETFSTLVESLVQMTSSDFTSFLFQKLVRQITDFCYGKQWEVYLFTKNSSNQESLKSTISVVKNVPYKITNFFSRQI